MAKSSAKRSASKKVRADAMKVATVLKSDKELTRLGSALRALGGLGGSAVGNLIGQAEGGRSLGTSLGASLSRWLGSGAYTVRSNSLLRAGIPAMHSTNQTVRVRHKEFLGPVTGSVGFTVFNSYTLNPSDPVTFPWLHRIARCYQQYSIKGAIFHYVPTSGFAISGTNPAVGAVMLQTTYRSTDTPPLDKVEILNEYWSSEGPPNEAFVHPIECDPKENPFQIHYVGAPSTGADQLMYDVGKTFVATQGMPGANVVGDLWITYDIEFKKPVVRSDSVDQFDIALGAVTEVTTTTLFSGMIFTGLDFESGSNVLSFPQGSAGRWMVFVQIKALTSFTVADFSGALTVVDCTALDYDRTVLGGTTPTLSTVFRRDEIVVSDSAVSATITYPTPTLTPSTHLSVFVCVSRIA